MLQKTIHFNDNTLCVRVKGIIIFQGHNIILLHGCLRYVVWCCSVQYTRFYNRSNVKWYIYIYIAKITVTCTYKWVWGENCKYLGEIDHIKLMIIKFIHQLIQEIYGFMSCAIKNYGMNDAHLQSAKSEHIKLHKSLLSSIRDLCVSGHKEYT